MIFMAVGIKSCVDLLENLFHCACMDVTYPTVIVFA